METKQCGLQDVFIAYDQEFTYIVQLLDTALSTNTKSPKRR